MSAVSKGDAERRYVTAELRADRDGTRRIDGYAVVFNQRSENLGGFVEIIAPEAVDRTIRENIDVRAFWNHDSGEVLGRLSAGTLQIKKDRRGLKTLIDPPGWADRILESIDRGDVTGMSFGFRTIDDEWDMDGDLPIRTITDMRIFEVSVVSMPAYPATTAEVAQRSLQAFLQARGGSRLEYLERVNRLARVR